MTTDNDAETPSSGPSAEPLAVPHADVVVSASGEIDMASAPALFDAVTDALVPLIENGGRLIIEISAVTFMDSAGLKAIALACQNLPGRVVVRNASDQVRRLLDISGIGRFVELEG